MKPIPKRPPLRWHVICLGRTLAKFWKRGDAREWVKHIGGGAARCCKVTFVGGKR